MRDAEGFPIVEEGTLAKRIPYASKYTVYYATFYGRIVARKYGRWQVVWYSKSNHYSPAAQKRRKSTLMYRKMGGSRSFALHCKFVHRLVAMSWLPTGELWQTKVDHIDGNRFNNRADNLRWCNDSENQRYASAIRRGETIISNLQKCLFYAD